MVPYRKSSALSANTERYIKAGLDTDFLDKMARVISALHKAGFDPYNQLTGFVRTRNTRYITRIDGARELIGEMNFQHIKVFLKYYDDQK